MVTRRAVGRYAARFGAVVTAVAAAGVVAVGAAPGAVAAPASDGGCPSGYQSTSADGTFVGAAVPGKVEESPGSLPGRPSDATAAVPKYGELVGTGCYRRDGGTATMRFSWSSIGPIDYGSFVYQLFDCTTGATTNELTRRLSYETAAGTSDSAVATLAVDPGHTYRMRISGKGSYKRGSDGFTGLAGYWDVRAPEGTPVWIGNTPCA